MDKEHSVKDLGLFKFEKNLASPRRQWEFQHPLDLGKSRKLNQTPQKLLIQTLNELNLFKASLVTSSHISDKIQVRGPMDVSQRARNIYIFLHNFHMQSTFR